MPGRVRHLTAVPDLPPTESEVRQVRALPSAWDGHEVQWGEWMGDTSAVLHVPVDHAACTECGGLSGRRQASGVYWIDPGDVVHASGMRRLIASRCLDCGLDQVCELVPGSSSIQSVWDLDDTDYGPDGSWPTGQGTLL